MNIATIKDKLDELDKRLPVRETILIPSDCFFVRELTVPEGTLPAEIQSFAQLQVESLAPFPIESLDWGYVTAGSTVLVYAATMERVKSFALNGLDNIWNAFPAFLPFAIQPAPTEDTVKLAIAANSASALFYKVGQSLPTRILSCRLTETTSLSGEDAILAARAEAVERLSLGDNPRLADGVDILDGVNDKSDDSISFTVSHVSSDGQKTSVSFALSSDALWNADIRGRLYADEHRVVRRRDSFIWRAFAAACVTTSILLVLTFGLFAVKTTGAIYRAIVRHHSAEVDLLQNKSDFASNLESVTEREMKPFSMLAVANAKRPADLYYEKVSATDWNVLHIEGGANRSDLIQGYIEELGRDPNVRDVRTIRTATTGGNSTFDIEVVFNPLEDASAGR